MGKIKNPRITLARGVAQYPYLNAPDTKWKTEGEYKTGHEIPLADAQDAMTQIEAMHKENLATVKAENKGKRIKEAELPFIVNEETGTVTFKPKMKAKVEPKNGEPFTQRPALFDGRGNPLDPNVKIGGGSVIKTNVELIPFYTAIAGAGVSLRLIAVQVIELRSGGGKSASAFGFDADENGFDGSSAPVSSMTEISDEDFEAPAAEAPVAGSDF